MLPLLSNDFDDNNITKIAARAEESRHQPLSAHTLRAQDKDRRRYDSKHQMVSTLRNLRSCPLLRMKPYHDPAEQIETEDVFLPKNRLQRTHHSFQNKDANKEMTAGALSSFFQGSNATHNLLQVPIAELAERWTELPQVSAGVPRNCRLSYRSIAARVGRDPLTVSRIWNRWVQDGNTKLRAGSQRSPIASSQKDEHVTLMALMDRAVTSRALSQELGSFAQQVSTRTVRRRLQQHGLSARRPWLRLPLTLHHREDRLQ
ncbi:HTH_Tnp_Tc3_2 domain-containing protein [Trichonephila clavipes]|nr:HTH_Tnp_Tc3_2 domain-containing protein [Trichonephila clavipes]